MPNLPDIPGRGLIEGTTRRTRVVIGAAGAGALAVGGLLAKRVLGHGGHADDGTGASADPIAETPTAPPGAEKKPTPKPKAAPPKAAEPKSSKPAKASKPKPKPVKPKPAKAKVAKPAKKAKSATPKPKAKPAEVAGGKDPHHALNNPIDDPDPTEYPDPFEKREDPLDPADPDGAPFGEEPHPATGAESTSEPPPAQDPEVPDGGKPPRRDNLDD